ncbi:MAG TPA: 50S ribosomal protein L17 [Planctomycetota bacterium]|nr:50S ribosomal protein L17 [Planctomycetota bacterium]
MRHRHKKGRLTVSPSHHVAMRRNLVASLFEHGSIVTTVAKAKSFRPFAEKLITLARRGNARKAEGTPEGKAAHLHAVRRAAQLMPHRPAVRTLFGRVAPAAGERQGGYTRIVRLGKARIGDRAPLVLFQLVDKPAAPAEGAPAAAEEKKGKGAGKGEEKVRRGKKARAAAAAESS